MSDREKDMVQRIADLPQALQDKFLERLEGAVMALDAMQPDEADNGEG